MINNENDYSPSKLKKLREVVKKKKEKKKEKEKKTIRERYHLVGNGIDQISTKIQTWNCKLERRKKPKRLFTKCESISKQKVVEKKPER